MKEVKGSKSEEKRGEREREREKGKLARSEGKS